MPAPFIVPFNFSPPISPSVKTTSYTVPVGKYALVKVYYEGIENQVANSTVTLNTRTITLNGVTILFPQTQSTNGASAANATVTITFPRQAIAVWTGNTSVPPITLQIGGTSNALTTSYQTITLSAASFSMALNATTQTTWNCRLIYDTVLNHTFWTKAGDVITGTGNWRALVTEYNVIS